MKKLFTLIELIVVIVVLGILAAIVIPNISSLKEDAISTMVGSNIRSIQTSSDMYHLREGKYATARKSSITEPMYVDMTAIVPNDLRQKPDESQLSQYYWIDYSGRVWGSTVKPPSNFMKNSETIEFGHKENAVSYRVYSVKDNVSSSVGNSKYSFVGEYSIEGTPDVVQLKTTPNSGQTLISSVDRFGYETAPVGLDYSVQENDWFSPLLNKTGEFVFEIESKDTMIWDAYSSVFDKPEGSDIKFEFSVLKEDGTFTPYNSDFNTLVPSKHIKAKVIMTSTGPKKPSLYELNIFYHFGQEEVVKGPIVSEVKLPDGKTVVVEEIQLPPGKEVVNIEQNSSQPEVTKTTTIVTVKEGSTWREVELYTEIPAGSTVRVETTYSTGEVAHQPTVVTVEEEPNVVQPELTVPVVKPNDPNEPDPVTPEEPAEEWETIQTLNFAANSGSSEKANWISVVPTDNKPESTRIVYTYSISNSTSYGDWTGNYKESEMDLVPDSRSLRVTATLQVLKDQLGKVPEPTVTGIKINSEKGELPVTNLSTYNPADNVTWYGFSPLLFDGSTSSYYAFPRGEGVYEVSWFGDISGRTLEIHSGMSIGDYLYHSFLDSEGNKIVTVDSQTKQRGTDFSPVRSDTPNRLLVPENAVKLVSRVGRFSSYNANMHEVRLLPKSAPQVIDESIVSVIPSTTLPEVDFVFQKPHTEIGHVILQNGKKPANLKWVSTYAQKDAALYTDMDYEYDIYITGMSGEFLNTEPIKKTIHTPKSPSGVELRGLPSEILQPFNNQYAYQLSSKTEEVTWIGDAAGKTVTIRASAYGDRIVAGLLDANGNQVLFPTGVDLITVNENSSSSTVFTLPSNAKVITFRKADPNSNNAAYTAKLLSIQFSN